MQTLSLTNYGRNNLLQQTRLDADAAAGQKVTTVQNNAGFSTGDYYILGTPGAETTERLVVDTITGATTITATANLTLAHKRFDYVTKLFGNQLKVYRAANVNGLQPADDAFTELATVDIQPDQSHTDYTDDDGGSDYWYKFTYYNSSSTSESSLADSQAMRGGGTGDYCSVDAIREEAGFKSAPYVTDAMIDAKRQAAQAEINGKLKGNFTVPFTPPINPFITDICRRLAAGLLQVEQYGQNQSRSTMDGQTRIDKARADLEGLASGDITLIDTAGNDLALPGANGSAASWPNAETADADVSDGGAPRYFRMGSVNGYTERDF